jgi:acetyl coenzyme A synthetase (ADP forming)-like protein
MMNILKKLFSPKSIAIVGASPKSGKLGNVLIENIKKGGWKGKLYFVNPKYVKSRKDCYSNLNEIKKPVDLVLIAIPAPFIGGAIEDGAKARPAIKNFAVISSGFKEAGLEGKKLEEELENIAKKYDLNILGPNCLGFASPKEKLNATFTNMKLQTGSIAVISQSGALVVALLDWAENKKIGFSEIISIGNKTVLDESAILNYLATDKSTKAIALYLEDIKSGLAFMQTLAKMTLRKPVVILKAGKTSVGQKAISSHTGSLAQDEEIIEAVFEKLNVIPAGNIEEFQNIIYYLNFNPIPARKEIVILTNAGGPGVMASDFVGKSKNIKLLDFPTGFKDEIKKYLPASASLHNPIDVIGDAPPERYAKTIEQIAKYFPKNPLLVMLTPQNQTDPGKVADILAKAKNKIPNLSACFMGGEKIEKAKRLLEKNNIAVFENPERVLSVVEKLAKYSQQLVIARSIATKQSRPTPKNTELLLSPRRDRNDIFKNRKMLFWKETERLFGTYQVKLAKSFSFENFNELKSQKKSFPCALKTDDPRIAHRLEKNAVVLDIQNKKELQKTFEKMKKETGANHFLLQPMADPDLELIIGMKRDPTFGPVVLCGWGGSLTEIFKDKIILMPPFDRKEAKRKLSELAIFPILKGFRGKNGYDLNEISKIITSIAQIAVENTRIREIDINPLVVYNNGKPGKILDAKIFLT